MSARPVPEGRCGLACAISKAFHNSQAILVAGCALAVGGCVHLVALDQTLVGGGDYSAPVTETLCDPEVEIGASAFCDESCRIDVRSGESTCGDRVRMVDDGARVDVSGLHELEMLLSICPSSGESFQVTAQNGASVSVDQRTLVIRPKEGAPLGANDYVSYECADRTLVFQTARLAVTDSGQRFCSDTLLSLEGEWAMKLPRHQDGGLRSLELCFRSRERSSHLEAEAANVSQAAGRSQSTAGAQPDATGSSPGAADEPAETATSSAPEEAADEAPATEAGSSSEEAVDEAPRNRAGSAPRNASSVGSDRESAGAQERDGSADQGPEGAQ